MRKLKEVLRLHSLGMSQHQIARSCSVSQSTVHDYVSAAQAALERRLRDARLQGTACMEDIDYRAARGLDKQVGRSLIQDSDWVRRHQHIFLVGPTGIGKTYLARAFGQKACRDGFTAYFA